MEIVYRPMHLSDIDRVWKLLEILKEEKSEVSLVEIPDREGLKEWLENETLFLYIAEDDNQILGLLRAVRDYESHKRHSAFLSLAIHPDYRIKGIAKELAHTALDDMKKDGILIARAYVYSDNTASINLVLRLGFTFGGAVHMHHFNEKTKKYVDDLIFHKLL